MQDALLRFSTAQAPTATGDTASTDYLDQLAAGDIMVNSLFLEIQTVAAVTSAGAATVQFVLQTDDNSAFSSPNELWASAAIPKATLVAGYRVVQVKLPVGMERFSRIAYRIGTAALTTGSFDAYFTDAVANRIK